jgi:hypothetical protein
MGQNRSKSQAANQNSTIVGALALVQGRCRSKAATPDLSAQGSGAEIVRLMVHNKCRFYGACKQARITSVRTGELRTAEKAWNAYRSCEIP